MRRSSESEPESLEEELREETLLLSEEELANSILSRILSLKSLLRTGFLDGS